MILRFIFFSDKEFNKFIYSIVYLLGCLLVLNITKWRLLVVALEVLVLDTCVFITSFILLLIAISFNALLKKKLSNVQKQKHGSMLSCKILKCRIKPQIIWLYRKICRKCTWYSPNYLIKLILLAQVYITFLSSKLMNRVPH